MEFSPNGKKYPPFYLNEFSYRFNNRRNENMFADLITACDQTH